MDSQHIEQELETKNTHDLLVMLVSELKSIRQILEAGYEYSIEMDESRSGAWGGTYSGRIKSKGYRRYLQPDYQTSEQPDLLAQAEQRLAMTEEGTIDVILVSSGVQLMPVIKSIREITKLKFSLLEAKKLAETPGSTILVGVSQDIAQQAKSKLEATGATVELRQAE